MKNNTSFLAINIDTFNRKNKEDIKLRKCLKCLDFDRTIYKCKLKKCNKSESWK